MEGIIAMDYSKLIPLGDVLLLLRAQYFSQLSVNLALLLIHKIEICLPSLKHVTVNKTARKY